MSLAPRLWLNIPNSLACSRRGGLTAAAPKRRYSAFASGFGAIAS
jgi:hypothetical protein